MITVVRPEIFRPDARGALALNERGTLGLVLEGRGVYRGVAVVDFSRWESRRPVFCGNVLEWEASGEKLRDWVRRHAGRRVWTPTDDEGRRAAEAFRRGSFRV